MYVEFDCEVCGKHVRKQWSPKMPGSPRFCCWACKSESQRRQKPVDRDWLYQKYIIEGMDCTQIAKLVRRNSKRVWEWLRDLGIPTRARGTNQQVLFKKGHKPATTGTHRSEETKAKIRKARLEDGRVPYLKNGQHHLKGKRGAETPNWRGGCTPERQSFYAQPEWKEAVKAVWKRDDAKCRRCGLDSRILPVNKRHFHIHHLISFSDKTERANPDNLVLLCRSCHLFVHSAKNTGREFIHERP